MHKWAFIIMNRLKINTGLTGEGLAWVIESNPWEEGMILQEENKLQNDIKALFFPDTPFVAPGMDRKNTEEDEEDDEDIDSCDSSDDEIVDELSSSTDQQ